jgi:hypothetical protein
MASESEIIRKLRARIETLEEENLQLREDTAKVDATFCAFLSRTQVALLMAIYKRSALSQYVATYAHLDHITEAFGQYNRYGGEMHQTVRTKVAVFKLRNKLKPYGIEIKTWRGVGYYFDDENKAKLKQLMEKKDD